MGAIDLPQPVGKAIVDPIDMNRHRTTPARSEPPSSWSSFGWLELLTTGVVLDSVAITQRLYLTPANEKDSLAFTEFALGEQYVTGDYELQVDEPARRRRPFQSAGGS